MEYFVNVMYFNSCVQEASPFLDIPWPGSIGQVSLYSSETLRDTTLGEVDPVHAIVLFFLFPWIPLFWELKYDKRHCLFLCSNMPLCFFPSCSAGTVVLDLCCSAGISCMETLEETTGSIRIPRSIRHSGLRPLALCGWYLKGRKKNWACAGPSFLYLLPRAFLSYSPFQMQMSCICICVLLPHCLGSATHNPVFNSFDFTLEKFRKRSWAALCTFVKPGLWLSSPASARRAANRHPAGLHTELFLFLSW